MRLETMRRRIKVVASYSADEALGLEEEEDERKGGGTGGKNED